MSVTYAQKTEKPTLPTSNKDFLVTFIKVTCQVSLVARVAGLESGTFNLLFAAPLAAGKYKSSQ